MAQADSAKMRLFTTFAGKAPAESIQGPASGAQGEGTDPARRLKQLSAGSSRWSPFFAFSSKHDLPTTSLLLQCIGLGHASSQELRTFDGQAAGAGGSGGGAAARDGLDGQLAAALAERLVPGWWHLTHTVPGWRWHLQASLGRRQRLPGNCHLCPPLSSAAPLPRVPTLPAGPNPSPEPSGVTLPRRAGAVLLCRRPRRLAGSARPAGGGW
jgi:hypothetical protein